MTERTAVDVVRSLGITMSYDEAADNPLWPMEWREPVHHYRCTLRYGRRKFETYCSMADEDLHRLPTAPLMVCIILTEVGLFEACRDLDDLAGIFNGDEAPDEQVVEQTYKNLQGMARGFRKFLSPRLYDELTSWAITVHERSAQ